MAQPFEKMLIADLARDSGLSPERALDAARGLERKGLMVVSMDGTTCMFTTDGHQTAEGLALREMLEQLNSEDRPK